MFFISFCDCFQFEPKYKEQQNRSIGTYNKTTCKRGKLETQNNKKSKYIYNELQLIESKDSKLNIKIWFRKFSIVFMIRLLKTWSELFGSLPDFVLKSSICNSIRNKDTNQSFDIETKSQINSSTKLNA